MKVKCEYEIPDEVFEKAVDNSLMNNPDFTLVTRCKDCKHRYSRERCVGRRPDWYCADGEKREQK